MTDTSMLSQPKDMVDELLEAYLLFHNAEICLSTAQSGVLSQENTTATIKSAHSYLIAGLTALRELGCIDEWVKQMQLQEITK